MVELNIVPALPGKAVYGVGIANLFQRFGHQDQRLFGHINNPAWFGLGGGGPVEYNIAFCGRLGPQVAGGHNVKAGRVVERGVPLDGILQFAQPGYFLCRRQILA